MSELYTKVKKVYKSGKTIEYLLNGKIVFYFFLKFKNSYFYRIFPRLGVAYIFYFRNQKDAVFSVNELGDGLKYRNLKNTHIDDNSISRIIKAYNRAKTNQPSQPDCYQTGGLWELMSIHHENLIKALETKNVKEVKGILNNLATSEVSQGLSLSGGMPINFKERIEWLNIFNQGHRHWKFMTNRSGFPASCDESIGNLFGIKLKGEILLQPSFRLSYFAQRINDLLSPSEEVRVLEIGGGFGGLPFHLFKEQSICKTYLNFDIPEVLVICSYFLMSSFPDKSFQLYGEGETADIDLDNFQIILLPNFAIQEVQSASCDLIFNSHSLTEMDNSSVVEYLAQIERISRKYFLHANHEFGLNKNYNYKSRAGKDKSHVYLNSTDYELPREKFRKIYRMPEVIQNGTYGYHEYDYFEYLYEKI